MEVILLKIQKQERILRERRERELFDFSTKTLAKSISARERILPSEPCSKAQKGDFSRNEVDKWALFMIGAKNASKFN